LGFGAAHQPAGSIGISIELSPKLTVLRAVAPLVCAHWYGLSPKIAESNGLGVHARQGAR